MFANWLILDGRLFAMRKGERHTVELAIMWRHKFYKVKRMTKVLIYGALECWPMN